MDDVGVADAAAQRVNRGGEGGGFVVVGEEAEEDGVGHLCSRSSTI